jgi:hypothetical protein
MAKGAFAARTWLSTASIRPRFRPRNGSFMTFVDSSAVIGKGDQVVGRETTCDLHQGSLGAVTARLQR